MEMIPERKSLVAQSVEILREMIRKGEWDNHLPTEAELQERMQVGRNTVRSALAVLEKDGWISGGRPGLRREILRHAEGGRSPSHTRLVAFLAPDALERARAQVVLTVGGLRDHLAELGYRLEIHTSKAFRLEHPERTLEALVRKSPADLWVLHLSAREMQAWFARKEIPCLIYGSTHEGIQLPCVDLDYAAVTRHAVGHLLARGHTNLALMLPNQNLYGNQQAEKVFDEAMQVDRHPSRTGAIIRVPANDPETICQELKRIMRRAKPPTGVILWRVRYAITVFSYVQQLGLRVPEDLSVICADDSSVVEWLVPNLSRYRVRQSTISTKLFRRIHEMLTTGSVTQSRVLILPDWQPGGSVARPQGA